MHAETRSRPHSNLRSQLAKHPNFTQNASSARVLSVNGLLAEVIRTDVADLAERSLNSDYHEVWTN